MYHKGLYFLPSLCRPGKHRCSYRGGGFGQGTIAVAKFIWEKFVQTLQKAMGRLARFRPEALPWMWDFLKLSNKSHKKAWESSRDFEVRTFTYRLNPMRTCPPPCRVCGRDDPHYSASPECGFHTCDNSINVHQCP